MTAGKYSRRTLLPLALLLGGLCLALGGWQLERAVYKERLLAARASAAALPARPLSAALHPAEGQRVLLHGRWDRDHPFLLDNRLRNGRPGLELLQPLHLDGGGTVLVMRGWLPWPRRERLPGLPPLAERAELTGVVSFPGSPLLVSSGPDTFGSGWPRLSEVAMPALLAGQLGYPLLSYLVVEAPPYLGPPAQARPPFGPERHRAYAVQWFVLAVLLPLLAWRAGRQGTGR